MSGTQKLEKFQLVEPQLEPPREEPPREEPPREEPRESQRAMDREPAVEQLRTRLARKFTTLADEVTASFEEFQIGAGAWRPELTAPEGMSTGGGKQATQHLRLRPMRQDHAVLVGGLVNPVTKTAELRNYEHMVALQHARFGAASSLGITFDEWEQFLRRTEQVLRGHEIATTRTAAPRELRLLASKGPGVSQRTLAVIAFSVIVPLAAIVGWRVLVVLMH